MTTIRSQLMAAAMVALAVLLTHIVLLISAVGLAEFSNSITDDANFFISRAALWLLTSALTGGAAFLTLRQRGAMPVKLFAIFAVAAMGFFLESWITFHLVGLAMDFKFIEPSNMGSGVRASRGIGTI